MSQTLELLLAPANEVSQLDIPAGLVTDLILRYMFQYGEASGNDIQQIVRLNYRIIDEILGRLQQEHLLEVRSGTTGLGRGNYNFVLTDEGKTRARDAFDRAQYVGPAPVPLEKYSRAILMQSIRKQKVSQEQVQQGLRHLILPSSFHRRIGPAINAGSSIFLYGPPGNGKTTVAQAIAKLVAGSDPIWLPFAVTIAGQIIQVYDQLIHKPAENPDPQARVDGRWALYQRPFVLVGGELMMESLDLRFDPIAKFYEAPLQMKANGGMFLIDDFGRQQVSPTQLLNRWIVPLETHVDMFRLQSGQSFHVPFQQLIVFSTNLDPAKLVDDAFLRRIQMKVEVSSPDDRMFLQIFLAMCKTMKIPFDKDSFAHLLQHWYYRTGRKLQAVHPRDILRVALALSEYEGVPCQLTPALIDEACESYFVEMGPGQGEPTTARV